MNVSSQTERQVLMKVPHLFTTGPESWYPEVKNPQFQSKLCTSRWQVQRFDLESTSLTVLSWKRIRTSTRRLVLNISSNENKNKNSAGNRRWSKITVSSHWLPQPTSTFIWIAARSISSSSRGTDESTNSPVRHQRPSTALFQSARQRHRFKLIK